MSQPGTHWLAWCWMQSRWLCGKPWVPGRWWVSTAAFPSPTITSRMGMVPLRIGRAASRLSAESKKALSEYFLEVVKTVEGEKA